MNIKDTILWLLGLSGTNQATIGPIGGHSSVLGGPGSVLPAMSAEQQADSITMENLRNERDAMFEELRNFQPDVAPGGKYGFDIQPPDPLATGRPGPVDILAPEITSYDDLMRKRQNMFRMV